MWLLYSLGASMMWGLTYIINEEVFKKITPPTYLGLSMFAASLFLLAQAWWMGVLKRDVGHIVSSPGLQVLFVLGLVVYIIAELAINYSIAGKNATMAGLVEISYPLFIIFFSYLLIRGYQVGVGAVVGGFLIFLGVAIIYYFDQ